MLDLLGTSINVHHEQTLDLKDIFTKVSAQAFDVQCFILNSVFLNELLLKKKKYLQVKYPNDKGKER